MAERPKNIHRITVAQYRKQEGLEDEDAWMDYLDKINTDDTAPALCTHACTVEPDGRCEHGCLSLLRTIGLF